MSSTNTNNTEVKDFYFTDPESYIEPDWTNRDSVTEAEPDPIVYILSSHSCLVEECEITFSSYEDIKRELNNYIGDKVVSRELPDSYIADGRLNLYMIKPVLDYPTKFMVYAYTYDKVRYGCSFWNYIEYEFELLCDYLGRKNDQLEEAADRYNVPADSVFVDEHMVSDFSSYEAVKNALDHAIDCSNHNPYVYKEKELLESWFVIKPVVNKPTKFIIALYVPNDRVFIKYPIDLLYYMYSYRDCVEEHERKIAEEEAFQKKQFEDYLRLNPIEEEDASETDDDECPPLGIATAASVARANEILSAYKNNDPLEKLIGLNVDESVYVYDGIDIYE